MPKLFGTYGTLALPIFNEKSKISTIFGSSKFSKFSIFFSKNVFAIFFSTRKNIFEILFDRFFYKLTVSSNHVRP